MLIACARTVAAPHLVEQIRELATLNIDWEYLLRLARRHAVEPLLYLQLERHASDLLPPQTLGQLKKHYQENSARNAVLTAELCRLINLLSGSGIEVIPYKGPLLALCAYQNLALRRFVDLDIIVRRSDVLKARDLLLADGYAPTKSLPLNRQELLLRTQHNMQFTRDNHRLIVELHWEVAPRLFASGVQAEKLWHDLVTTEVNGTKIRALANDDLLFSLCIHGSRHLWQRLGWICDVAELISRHRPNWSALLERTAKAESDRMFLLGLYLAEKLLGASLPNEIKRRCDSDARLRLLAANIIERLFDGFAHVPPTAGEIFKYNITVRKSWTARARYFVYMFQPTDGDLGSHSIPAAFSFVYYLMRPFRLLFGTSHLD